MTPANSADLGEDGAHSIRMEWSVEQPSCKLVQLERLALFVWREYAVDSRGLAPLAPLFPISLVLATGGLGQRSELLVGDPSSWYGPHLYACRRTSGTGVRVQKLENESQIETD